MEYRRLGRTHEKVSTIGMGTWKIGSYQGAEERQGQVNALRRGVELGLNLIDTAEMYAHGRSEEVVADAVKGIRKDVFIASKVSPENLRRDDLVKACRASLSRLGTSYIDLYQVHWPNPKISIKETMTAMESLVEKGAIRFIGVSNFSVAQTKEASEALSKNELVSNQVEYSLSNRRVEKDVLPYCVKEGISLIAYSPLARGNVIVSVPDAIIRKYNMTPAQVMLNWVTRDEHTLAIPKAANISHLEENASSVSVRFEESEYDEISRA
ncbi:MAG: aldo/keto reductase [Nitrososphaerota archaeon]|jgi:diketogulonate reductase-like aldo/keto reductase|nr:aldo/keto reductase [Nitrososphaerota archaeon]MDG6943028.1 aldo/keto reductase [Nitrososphaerota archaeon]MDG6950757.1 aldo/keto reductase [Nitrososphaerota archaeon]